MTETLTAIPVGMTAFCATNLDDILVLLLFFAQVNGAFRRRHIVAGQYLGFSALVLASLPGFFGSMFLPRPWIGLLGIVPIAIGLSRWFNPDDDDSEETLSETPSLENSFFSSILSPQTYGVAAITIANGGDNIGIYVPLFANSSWERLLVMLGVFFLLVGVWCYIAYQLTRLRVIADNLTRYGNILIPFVLIGLGILILIDSHTLEHRGLTVLALIIGGWCLITLNRKTESYSCPVIAAEEEQT
ncbi:cadmium resistance transporter [Gloeothece verrucosa]|uniref:Cadmium resistance transporter n=1 Tax=Gloeothece verrucosa (strain PCC 7822) TaxID=497965 RepID=E0U6C4_GLOV7|nr:cadmium resistance transporter [Gloeothece verrucosa]ADN13567.1 cadmium resistance transporter [Gloeothece verrucosa PCC 7822]